MKKEKKRIGSKISVRIRKLEATREIARKNKIWYLKLWPRHHRVGVMYLWIKINGSPFANRNLPFPIDHNNVPKAPAQTVSGSEQHYLELSPSGPGGRHTQGRNSNLKTGTTIRGRSAHSANPLPRRPLRNSRILNEVKNLCFVVARLIERF